MPLFQHNVCEHDHIFFDFPITIKTTEVKILRQFSTHFTGVEIMLYLEYYDNFFMNYMYVISIV